jgi:hypothetical protein
MENTFKEAMAQAPTDSVDNLDNQANENDSQQVNNAPDGSQPVNEQHDYKERYESSTAEARRLNEVHQRTIEANVKIAERNPDFLRELVDTDKELANEVSQKLHGVDFDT